MLTSDEILQLTLEVDPVSAPPLNLLAKAKYDFTAKSPKELSFNKVSCHIIVEYTLIPCRSIARHYNIIKAN